LVTSVKLVGAGMATVAMGGAGIGIGVVFGAYIIASSRNPDMSGELFTFTILGFALTEAIALFSLMMSFLIAFAF